MRLASPPRINPNPSRDRRSYIFRVDEMKVRDLTSYRATRSILHPWLGVTIGLAMAVFEVPSWTPRLFCVLGTV